MGTMNRKKSCQQPDTLLTEAPAKFGPTAVEISQQFLGLHQSSRIIPES